MVKESELKRVWSETPTPLPKTNGPMFDSATKHQIDVCREVLFGELPDPESQVKHIALALVYKFMNDMDLESGILGQGRRLFTGDLGRYRWSSLMAPGVSDEDLLRNYSEALAKMAEDDRLPPPFRSIFRDASLPSCGSGTMAAFLREIGSFSYDPSGRSADVFEYLLSALGTEGNEGEFRTPRHIVDFMVDILDPKKDEVILDPACGTGGFLISAYRHILKQNSTNAPTLNGQAENDGVAERVLDNPSRYEADMLTSDDRPRLLQNIRGYDISPDMVRLCLANLYLHGFVDPAVHEYDTLTCETRWGEMADVIFSNPPFMSPPGGVDSHPRFEIQSKCRETQFASYIAQHLTHEGRAAILVPDGMIFEDLDAYREIRKMLAKNYLAAVICLREGMFNPYSWVEASILILDRAVAKASDHIAFFKVKNDGFSLDSWRKPVKASQLDQVKAELSTWLQSVRNRKNSSLKSALGGVIDRKKVAEESVSNLVIEFNQLERNGPSPFPMVAIGEVCNLRMHETMLYSNLASDGPYLAYNENGIIGHYYEYNHEDGEILVVCRGNASGTVMRSQPMSWISGSLISVTPKDQKITKDFLFEILQNSDISPAVIFNIVPEITLESFASFLIPLPPLEKQRKIVDGVKNYQQKIANTKKSIMKLEEGIGRIISQVWKEKMQ